MNDPFNPVFSILSLLLAEEQKRIARLSTLRNECGCLVVINPCVPLKAPRLSPSTNPETSIGEVVELCESRFPESKHMTRFVAVVDQLTHMLFLLGLFNVDRETVLKAANIDESLPPPRLLDLLGYFFEIPPEELALRRVGYLGRAFADKAARKQRGLPVMQDITVEAYLAFFRVKDLELVSAGLSVEQRPVSGAQPVEVIRLLYPGVDSWFYYRESVLSQFSCKQDLDYSCLTSDEHDQLLRELTKRGTVQTETLGVHLSKFRECLKQSVIRYGHTCEQVRRKSSRRLARLEN